MISSLPKLTCPSCGNSSRFVEFMESETHLIDGDLNYIRLLDCSVDFYCCWECNEIVELPSDVSEE